MARRVVTVFGGSGFIGRHLVRRLTQDGAMVRVCVRDTEDAAFLKTMGDIGQVVLIPTNVTDSAQVSEALRGADEAVNLVGLLSEWGKQTFKNIHVDAAANIARAAKDNGVKRLVHISAIGADEKSASAYARTKAAGEAAVKAAFPDATIVRPSVVFGPEDRFFNLFASMTRFSPVLPVFGCPVIPKVTVCACQGREPGIDFYGEGGTRMQPLFVGDLARAITGALADSGSNGVTYELGGAEAYSFKQLMEMTLEASARKRLLVPIPFFWISFWAWFLQKWPAPLMTCDQVELLKSDNVVDGNMPGLADLGSSPVSVRSVLPTYLSRFRPQTADLARSL